MQTLAARRSTRWALSFISGLLMVVAFPKTGGLFPFTFVSWIPLLLVEGFFADKKKAGQLFLHAYFTFFVYNVGTTWWIVNADPTAALMAFLANSLLMALAFLVFHLIKRKLSARLHLLAFLSVWLTFEWLHFNWELSWPWLTFGNVFANVPAFVQWYSITGIFGGSLWVLLVNYLLFDAIRTNTLRSTRKITLFSTLILTPILISLLLGTLKSTDGKVYNVTVIQPNKDPYSEKFSGSNQEQLNRLFQLAKDKSTAQTQLIVAPETALYPNKDLTNGFLVVDQLPAHEATRMIRKFQETSPASFLIGASTLQFFEKPNSSASNFNPYVGTFEEDYNSSLLFDPDTLPKCIHKSKLVLGVEKIPFISTMPFLKTLAMDMGGGSGSLGIAEKPSVFHSKKVIFSPVVCYESIYGEFVARQSKLGSQFIAVITNDGWWGDTPGYRQHFLFSGLRAIENNKWVVRSANTGISGIFNNKGEVITRTNWDEELAFNATIRLNNSKTIYMFIGDIIPKIAAVVLIGILFAISFKRFFRKTKA